MKKGTENQNKIAGVLFIMAGTMDLSNVIRKIIQGGDYLTNLLFSIFFTAMGIFYIFKKIEK